MKDTLGVLLAGGAGERLYPLTRDRAKPAVTFGGIYRIIDITLSNCLNSDLRRVYILTQYKALSLNRHIREGWNIVASEIGEFVEVLPPDEARQRQLVSGHRGRGLPEHLFHRLGAAEARPDPFRRSHLQDGLRHDAEAAQDSAPMSRWPRSRLIRKRPYASAWWMSTKTAALTASRRSPKSTTCARRCNPDKVVGFHGHVSL